MSAPRWLSAQARIAVPVREKRKNANRPAVVASALSAAYTRALSTMIWPSAQESSW